MAGGNLSVVRSALGNPIEAPADDYAAEPPKKGGRPPKAMPDDCPVEPVGTEDGTFWFLSALGELRALSADKVARNHILGLFAPETDYVFETWPKKKWVAKTGPDGKPIKDDNGENVMVQITTGWDTDEVGRLLMDVAAQRGVWNAREKVRGRGAWIDDDGMLVLHCGNHVLIGGAWRRPGLYEDMVYPTQPPSPKPVGDPKATGEEICPNLVGELRARGVEIAADASPAHVLLELLRTWSWTRPNIDPLLLMGWIGSAMIGGALDYRPLAWITGGKATGKSALQKVMGWLFGTTGILQSPDASEAGVRQVLGQQSLPVAIDEAEADPDNRKVLALVTLARLAATSQGNVLRGGQDHKGHEFRATSCFLFSSILVPPIPPQDKSRLAMLELERLAAGSREPRYDKREMMALGQWLRRRMLDKWSVWPRVLEAYGDALIDYGDQDGRAASQFGTLLAAAHVLTEDDLPDEEHLVAVGGQYAKDRLSETNDLTDEAALCLGHLASSHVMLDRGTEPRTVGDWLLQATIPVSVDFGIEGENKGKRRTANERLQRIGLKVLRFESVTGRGADRPKPMIGVDYVAVASQHQGLAKLFQDSKWARGVWSQALKRTPGAMGGEKQRIGGVTAACVLVPVSAIVEHDGEAAEAERQAETVG